VSLPVGPALEEGGAGWGVGGGVAPSSIAQRGRATSGQGRAGRHPQLCACRVCVFGCRCRRQSRGSISYAVAWGPSQGAASRPRGLGEPGGFSSARAVGVWLFCVCVYVGWRVRVVCNSHPQCIGWLKRIGCQDCRALSCSHAALRSSSLGEKKCSHALPPSRHAGQELHSS
jgi:hypothetical protein